MVTGMLDVARTARRGLNRPFAVKMLLRSMLPAINSTDEYGQDFLKSQTTLPGKEEAEFEMPLMWIPGRRGRGLLHQLRKRRGTSAQHTRCGSAGHARSARAIVTAHPDAATWTHRAATGLRGPGPTSTPTGRTGGSPWPNPTTATDATAWTHRAAAGLLGASRSATHPDGRARKTSTTT